MVDINSIIERYKKKWISIEQLRRYVELGAITPAQYTEISGEEYTE